MQCGKNLHPFTLFLQGVYNRSFYLHVRLGYTTPPWLFNEIFDKKRSGYLSVHV
jgi:hypothetical protein